MNGMEIIDQWLEEIYKKDMIWFNKIKDEFNKLKNDFETTSNHGETTRNKIKAYQIASDYLFHFPQFVIRLLTYGGKPEEVFKTDLKIRKERLITALNKKVGDIVEVTLCRNNNDGLDGEVKGTIGNATLQTIGAGGYNIQRFHFRTIIRCKK